MQLPIPAAPADVEMHAWEAAGGGDIAPVIELHFTQPLDAKLLARAIELLAYSQPILATRLNVGPALAQWEAMTEPAEMLRTTSDAQEFERWLCVSPRATTGPQLAVYLYQGPGEDRLHIKITHQVGDGAASQQVAAHLADIYSHLSADPSYVPPVNTATERDHTLLLKKLSALTWLGIVMDGIKLGVALAVPRATQMPGLPVAAHPWQYVTRTFAPERVSLMSDYGRSRGATLNDLFLAALYRALMAETKWDGKKALRIIMTVDMRRRLPVSQPEMIRNLSTLEWPLLQRSPGVDFEDTLARVTKFTADRKRSRLGLAGAAFGIPNPKPLGLTNKRLEKTRRHWSKGELLTLSNEGRLEPDLLRFAGQEPSRAFQLALAIASPNLSLTLSGYKGSLVLSAAAPAASQHVIESLMDEMVRILPG